MQLQKRAHIQVTKVENVIESVTNTRHVIWEKELIGGNKAFLADYGVSEGHVTSRKELIFV